jgi:hypothetical protein
VRLFASLVLLMIMASIRPGFAAWRSAPELPVFGYTIQRVYPHDPRAYTQGLQYDDGFLYEGTGRNGESSIRKVKLESGQVLQRHDLSSEYFGRRLRALEIESDSAHVAGEGGVRVRPRQFRAEADVQLHRRGLGPDARRQQPDHERRHSSCVFLDPDTFTCAGESR